VHHFYPRLPRLSDFTLSDLPGPEVLRCPSAAQMPKSAARQCKSSHTVNLQRQPSEHAKQCTATVIPLAGVGGAKEIIVSTG
jgi:hypothetical protein